MPDADLQRILDELCRRREELAKIILRGDNTKPAQTEVASNEADPDATVTDTAHPEIQSP